MSAADPHTATDPNRPDPGEAMTSADPLPRSARVVLTVSLVGALAAVAVAIGITAIALAIAAWGALT